MTSRSAYDAALARLTTFEKKSKTQVFGGPMENFISEPWVYNPKEPSRRLVRAKKGFLKLTEVDPMPNTGVLDWGISIVGDVGKAFE